MMFQHQIRFRVRTSQIKNDNETLNYIDSFKYLGSILLPAPSTRKHPHDKQRRVPPVVVCTNEFRALNYLSTDTSCEVYKAVALSALHKCLRDLDPLPKAFQLFRPISPARSVTHYEHNLFI
ncbi:hypothetical protein ElyMa_005232000 [Elysia marginata]|uniref:Uncharacterized protein n=1 Tax=Elysia marginata TaxID=1093978 RepID=A0AAV4JW88_9GAST|nr:hypothetical protein ElyMa_005232000 [Elysia marginata]